MKDVMESEYGNFQMERGKGESNTSLQAWNSADLYLLKELRERQIDKKKSLLIINDQFGALCVSLYEEFNIIFLNDSHCSQKECLKNLERNILNPDKISFLNPMDPIPEKIDCIIMKTPKSLNYLEYLLQLISNSMCQSIPIIAADMAKNIHRSTIDLMEYYLKDVKTSLAWKKSRLFMGLTKDVPINKNTYPVSYEVPFASLKIVNYPNLFAHGRLDPGTAFFLTHFPEIKENSVVLDLACGDGILGIKAALNMGNGHYIFSDESHLAIKSAKESHLLNNISCSSEFIIQDILEDSESDTVDVILCNPPFHNLHSLSTTMALTMFKESYRILNKGGFLHVIANKHLAYEKHLKKDFSSVEIVNTNKKFSIIKARK